MKHTSTVHEQVSALADGHLRDDEFAQVIEKVCTDDDLCAADVMDHIDPRVPRLAESVFNDGCATSVLVDDENGQVALGHRCDGKVTLRRSARYNSA